MLLRKRFYITVVVLATMSGSSGVMARDELESIVTKPKLSRDDTARIQIEVHQRVENLVEAGDNAQRRLDARKRIIATSKIKNASRAGLDFYAQTCADELSDLMSDDNLDVALAAALILVELNHVATVDAIIKALSSKHAAVRYHAAHNIELLHVKLAGNRESCQSLLQALGRTGASEKNQIVLRACYQAIHFNSDVSNFRFNEDVARSLNAVFAGRLDRLSQGSHDEWKDSAGYTAAVDCYARAGIEQQKALIGDMTAFLSNHVNRYFHKDTAPENLSTLSRLARETETAIRKMMQSSQVTPPSDRVGRYLKSNPPSASHPKNARAAVNRYEAMLHDAPWNLP